MPKKRKKGEVRKYEARKIDVSPKPSSRDNFDFPEAAPGSETLVEPFDAADADETFAIESKQPMTVKSSSSAYVVGESKATDRQQRRRRRTTKKKKKMKRVNQTKSKSPSRKCLPIRHECLFLKIEHLAL